MNIREERDAKVDHVRAKVFALMGALQGYREGGSGGHGANRRQVGGAVMLDHLQTGKTGIDGSNRVEHGQPDVVADQDNDDDDQEDGKLLGDGTLPGQAAEGRCDEEGQNRDNDHLHDLENDLLEFLQDIGDGPGLCPHSSETDEDREDQGGHDRHDLWDVKLEGNRGKGSQALSISNDGQVGNDGIAGSHRHTCGQDAGNVGDDNGNGKHTGRVIAQLGDGRRDKTDDNQRNTEGDQLTEDIFDCDNDDHYTFRKHQSQKHTNDDTQKKSEGKAFHYFHFVVLSVCLLSMSAYPCAFCRRFTATTDSICR